MDFRLKHIIQKLRKKEKIKKKQSLSDRKKPINNPVDLRSETVYSQKLKEVLNFNSPKMEVTRPASTEQTAHSTNHSKITTSPHN